MQLRDEPREVVEGAAYARILEKRAENHLGAQILERVADDDLPAERLRASFDHGYRLRQALLVDKEGSGLRLRDAVRKRHRLGHGGRLVKERGIGDVERRQIRDERLEVQKRFETPLTNLRLIGRVGGIPGRILEDVALNSRRHDRAVVTLADQRYQHAVLVGNR